MAAAWQLTHREGLAFRKAIVLDDEDLRSQLRQCASFAHHGLTRPDDLRELAALSLVLARRIERDVGS